MNFGTDFPGLAVCWVGKETRAERERTLPAAEEGLSKKSFPIHLAKWIGIRVCYSVPQKRELVAAANVGT